MALAIVIRGADEHRTAPLVTRTTLFTAFVMLPPNSWAFSSSYALGRPGASTLDRW